MSIVNKLLQKFSRNTTAPVQAPQPVAVFTVEQPINSAEVKFGFTSKGVTQYDPEQTYAVFATEQATKAGVSLQTNYTPQYIVGDQTYVVDPSLTFAQLNAKYNVTAETPVAVSIPDPERPAGRLG